jgi:DNA polymerase elongation subunit (family B)
MEEPQILAKTFAWWCEDFQTEEGKRFKVIIWAQTLEDEVISVVIEDFLPVLEVVLPEEFGPAVAETLCANVYDYLRQKLYNYIPDKDHQPVAYQGSLRYPLFYYTQDQQICMTLRFKSMEAAKHCQNLLQWPVKTSAFGSVKVEPSATKIPMIAKFRTAMKLLPCQWVQFSGTQVREDKNTKSRREYNVSYKNIKQCKEEDCSKYGDINPSLLIFDYEMVSKDAMAFPDEDNAADVVFMEGAIFLSWNKHKGEYDVREFLLVLTTLSKEQFGRIKGSKLIKIPNPSKPIYDVVDDEERDVEIRVFNAELDFLDGAEQLQIELNPTGVIGHNSIEFDHKYHKVRKGRLGESYQNLSRLERWIQGFTYIEWSSSAYHDQKIYVPDGPGRIYFDTYKMVQRDYKEDSYNLDVLGQKYLGIGKHDWSPGKIFESYRTQNPWMMNMTGKYCMRDVWCTWGLFQHFNFWTSYSNMANVMEVDIFDLFSQGQSIRTRAQTYSTCEQVGHFMHVPERVFRSIAGGHVFNQIPGVYEFLLLLDFMGLYPSIMRKFNVSPDTYDFYKKAKDEDCYILEWKDHQGEWSTRFVKETIRKGILPIQLEHLTDARNLEKQRMAEAKKRGDSKAAMIHNVNQNGYKVSSNSKYGAISQKGGTLGLSEAGAAVTAYGRMLVQKMGKWCEDNGWEVIYGDSVTGNTPILVRIKGEDISLVTMEALYSFCEEYEKKLGWQFTVTDDEKEYKVVGNIEVWSDQGWTKIQNIMRHKTNKRIYRVLTHTGYVEVTEDHSLLREDGKEVTPKELKIGDKLMQNYPTFTTQESNIITTDPDSLNFIETDPGLAFALGFFVADGSCGKYGEGSEVKYSWAINNQDYQLLLDTIELSKHSIKKRYNCGLQILETMESSNVYKLVATDNPRNITKSWRKMCYGPNKEKIIPECIMHASQQVKEFFFEGLYAGDGDKTASNGVTKRIDTKNQLSAASYYAFFTSMGYNVSINNRTDKPNIYRLTMSKGTFRRNPNAIKKIELLSQEQDRYVYDLTTENHHFQAGIGNIIVHNTDSVMIRKKGGLTDEEKMNFGNIGKELVKKLNDECFEKPIEVQLDGIMRTFVSLSKKMYTKIALDAENPLVINPRLFESKGYVTSRRDTCLMCRNLCRKMSEDVTALKPLDEVLMFIADELDRLIYGEVTTEELITILKLGPEYKNSNNMLALYQKHLLENGILVKAGDRLPHVYVKREKQTKYKGQCFEYPEIYEKNKDTMELDRLLYLKSQFANKIDTFLHACFPQLIPDAFIAKIPGFLELRKDAKVLQIMCALMETHMKKQ